MDETPIPSRYIIVDRVPTLEGLGQLAMKWVAGEMIEREPCIVFLNGPRGAGKTTFVSKVADQLGVTDVASPSFALHHRSEGIRGSIDHFDLDRLQSLEELESVGFWDLIDEARTESRRFVFVEWSQRLQEFGITDITSLTEGFRFWRFDFEGPPGFHVQRQRQI